MTPKEKLIEFMKDKQALLGKKSPKYFGIRDEKDIMKWSDEEALRVWIDLKLYPSFGTDSCPFCHYYERCETCTYGKRHGVCVNWDSDYDKLHNAREKASRKYGQKDKFCEKWENKNR